MNAEACSGYDLVEKTEMQDERIGKIYMGFCSVFITVVMVVFSIIWPPVLLDLSLIHISIRFTALSLR